MRPFLSLDTDRLLLRDLGEADFAVVHRYASDPEVVGFAHLGPNSEEDTREFLRVAMAAEREQPRKVFYFAVVLESEGRLIGDCRISVSAERDYEASIGCVLARDSRRRGFATEVMSALLRFGFQQLGLRRIVATCDPCNTASWRVMEKNGMRREGHLREDRRQKGEWRDSLLYAILEPEWKASRAGSPRPRA
jgi:RimJ/RimL family protein N-acetyltransferase